LEITAPALAKPSATIAQMTEERGGLEEQLAEIGAQLDWVRDYL
jgi:hypothetical protein